MISKDELIELIEEALMTDKGTITEDSSMENVDMWDSFGHLQIFMEIESKFNSNALIKPNLIPSIVNVFTSSPCLISLSKYFSSFQCG